jgi:hypothetical protein
MPLSGLSVTTEFSPEGRFRAPGRRAPQDRPAKAERQAPAPRPGHPAYHAGRFKTDLTQLQAFDGARDPASAESDQKLFDFFGNLSVLLLAVRAGDINRARAAADALEMEVLVERSAGHRPDAQANMLDDLAALLDAAQSRDESAARVAPKELAADFQSAVAPQESFAETARPDDGGAAYDTLTQYLGGGGTV